MAITLQCQCGQAVHLSEDNPSMVVMCKKCGSGLALRVTEQRYVWEKGEGWIEAETYCESCNKALLQKQVAWSDSEGVHLCAECAPKKGEAD